MVTTTETTARIVGERRLATIGDLAALASRARSEAEVWTEAANILRQNPADLAFCLLYRSSGAQSFALEQCCGVGGDCAAALPVLNFETGALQGRAWPVSKVLSGREAVLVDDVVERFGPVVGPKWPDPVRCALVLPIGKPGSESLYGILIVGISPRRALDDPYRSFLSLVADHIATGIGNVRTYEEERRRVEALAELDKAKTEFFSNVSHEFRTPLTLMLGPLEAALRDSENLPPEHRNHVSTAHRNSLRLLKLVNSLLDFARIEAGRIKATYIPSDLAALTIDLCSNFRAAMDAAGLKFVVDCPPLGELVYVDREMWEKIVLNLLSNAFKFTLQGEIAVSLRTVDGAAELRVRDSGVGIPAEEMSRLFERFHRVPNTQSRTHEGSGIGLALVQELAKLHGGSVRVESRVGKGSTFIVSIPLGKAHLPPEHIGGAGAAASTTLGAAPFVEEALRWIPDRASPEDFEPLPGEASLPAPRSSNEPDASLPRLLVADDNADMRQYLARILGGLYQVQAVPDGEAALDAARLRRPDLILSDMMMPRMDGAALLRELRADPDLNTVPVILLSARAGEESRVEGLREGADDYLIKPFSARELLARVAAHLELARLREQAEQAIRESEERYRSLFKHMLEGFAYCRMLFDEQGRPDDFVYLAVNEAFGKLTGLSGVVGKRVTELIPRIKELEPELFDIYGRVASTGNPERFEIDFKPLDVCLSISVYSPEPGHFVAVFDNITERKRAEAALRESEERFRALVTAGSYVVFRLSPDWTEMRQLVGREFVAGAGEPSRNWLATYVHPNDQPRALAAIEEAIRTRSVFDLEHQLLRPDGSLGWTHSRAVPILDSAGEIMEWFGTAGDITARKEAEERLRQAQKLESIGMLAGGIAHDFNNLLVGVIGNASLVEEMLPPDDPAYELVQSISKTGEQLAHLTRQMLAYSGKGRFFMEHLDLSAVVRDIADLIRPSIPRKVALQFELEEDLPVVEADRGQLQQILMNLVINAAEAIGSHDGTITVASGVRVVDAGFMRAHPEASCLRSREYVALEVRDTGCGMDESVRAKIFDPFFSTKFTGRGLGLAAVHGIVRGHAGAILVSSQPGKGSVFTVLFPAAGRNMGENRSPVARRSAKGSGTVLVIDDEEVVREMAKGALERNGYHVLVACDGPSAIDVFRRHPAHIDVAVLDLSMPGMSGEETLPELRKIRPDVKVLVSSGYNEAEAMAMFNGQRVSGFVQKPYTATSLAEKVKGALE
jgi:PAS domain S-box-containing protein